MTVVYGIGLTRNDFHLWPTITVSLFRDTFSKCVDTDSRWIAPDDDGEQIFQAVWCDDFYAVIRLKRKADGRRVFGPRCNRVLKRQEWRHRIAEMVLEPEVYSRLIGDLPGNTGKHCGEFALQRRIARWREPRHIKVRNIDIRQV